jgi:hypothetical protein
MAVQSDLGKVLLFSTNGGPAPYLIIAAHGAEATDKRGWKPDGRKFVFYGPRGKVVTVPPLGEIMTGAKHCVPFETIAVDTVEEYWLGKYAGSQNKIGVTYGTFQADLDLDDEFGNFHVLSVRRHPNGRFGKDNILLSEALAIAEKFNKMPYDLIYCCFCRGRPGQPVFGNEFEHTYLSNQAAKVVHR